MAEFALDIFKLLKALPSKKDVYSSLTDEEKKGFAPLVVQRWMSGCDDERQILMLNEFVNPYVFSIGPNHQHLLMRLMQASVSGGYKRYKWISSKTGKRKNLRKEVVLEYYDMSEQEYSQLTILPTNDEILELAEDLGWQKDELAKLKKELKDNKSTE